MYIIRRTLANRGMTERYLDVGVFGFESVTDGAEVSLVKTQSYLPLSEPLVDRNYTSACVITGSCAVELRLYVSRAAASLGVYRVNRRNH